MKGLLLWLAIGVLVAVIIGGAVHAGRKKRNYHGEGE
jgi:ribosomal protein L21E